MKHEAEYEVEAQLLSLSSEDPEWRHEEGHSMRYQEGRGTLAAWASVAPRTVAANERPGMVRSDQ